MTNHDDAHDLPVLASSVSLPNTPWVHLLDVESFILGQGLIPLDDDNGFIHLSRWITACGFSGVVFMGKPVAAGTDDALGEIQEIPTIYFRKERGTYDNALSRESINRTTSEVEGAIRDDKAGFGEPDWQEVIVNRSQLLQYIIEKGGALAPLASGAPGRPSSMHLVRMEFNRRACNGTMIRQLSAEAEFLAAWMKERFPTYPQPTAKTIRNNLLPLHRAAVAQN